FSNPWVYLQDGDRPIKPRRPLSCPSRQCRDNRRHCHLRERDSPEWISDELQTSPQLRIRPVPLAFGGEAARFEYRKHIVPGPCRGCRSEPYRLQDPRRPSAQPKPKHHPLRIPPSATQQVPSPAVHLREWEIATAIPAEPLRWFCIRGTNHSGRIR